DGATRTRMERGFGVRLDAVRVHRDPAAGRRVRALGADALALGSHVAFAPGEYRPGSPAHDRLLGHELGHVLQQRRAGRARPFAAVPAARTPAHEPAAPRLSDAAMTRLARPGVATSGPLSPAVSSAPAVQLGNREPQRQRLLSDSVSSVNPSAYGALNEEP